MSYGSDYLREAMTLNERKINNKKSLKESIKDKHYTQLKESIDDNLYTEIEDEVQYRVKGAINKVTDNLLDMITSDYPEYNIDWCSEYGTNIDEEEFVQDITNAIMENLFKYVNDVNSKPNLI